MAAAGAAVGLGNIWSFPSQTAQNGGATFVGVYLLFTLLVAYPALVAELVIGRYTRTSPVRAFKQIPTTQKWASIGFAGLLCVGLILSFYAIVGGWMMAYCLEPVLTGWGLPSIATWLVRPGLARDVLFTTIFYLLNVGIITAGIQQGIETWSKRLMPTLLVLLVGLIAYVLTLEGAMLGLKRYLIPDFGRVWDADLIVSAMGQAFFSASLGTGTMLVYGSYASKQQSLGQLGLTVIACDFGIAFLAGLLVMPAMYAAAAQGIIIFDAQGQLMEEEGIVFQVLPALFKTMGLTGGVVTVLFFLLMVIAALTSSISMLEVPVAHLIDEGRATRKRAAWLVGGTCWLMSLLIIYNAEWLFLGVVHLTTRYTQPFLGLAYCVFAGWGLQRHQVFKELQQGSPPMAHNGFYTVWWVFVRWVTPLLILAVLMRGLFMK